MYVSVIGRLRGEDALDGGDVQIQLETNTTDLSGTVIGENNILLESGTAADYLERIYGTVPVGLTFDETIGTFDSTSVTFDAGTPS